MRMSLINTLVVGASICLYACGGTTAPLTDGAGGTSATGGNRGPGAFGDGITYIGGAGGSTTYHDCPGPFSTSSYCGGSSGSQATGGSAGSPTGFGGAGGRGGGAGGSTPIPSDGGASSSSVLNLGLTWASSADAGAQLHNVVVMPDGTATCSEYRGDWLLIGREDQTDTQVAALLASPGTVDALATPCPLKVADVINATITTTFVGGTKVDRMVFASCSTDNLATLLAALRRIGDLCVATGTMIRDY